MRVFEDGGGLNPTCGLFLSSYPLKRIGLQKGRSMIQFESIRNPSAERLGARVEVSASLCQSAGIASAYAGLQGEVIAKANGNNDVLIQLDEASQAKHRDIESKAFSEAYRDFGAEQWFVSGVLEVVQSSEESEVSDVSSRI